MNSAFPAAPAQDSIPTFIEDVVLPTHLRCTRFFITFRQWRKATTALRTVNTSNNAGAAEFDTLQEVLAHARAILEDATAKGLDVEYNVVFFVRTAEGRRRVFATLGAHHDQIVRAVTLACPPALLTLRPPQPNETSK
ncbi:hypothetical protein [Deinococcus yavapaiensis]|uniref:hypothetical protein n=1 Tax=Deinococcus yavapaiensis TaxID=309889 RepID=UPI0011B76E18|nr:hypothetical protein [Deinococcus yavapaiensis]